MVLFRSRFEDRSKTNVVRLEPVGFFDLIHVMGRQTEQLVWPHQRSCVFNGQIVLTEMDPVGIDGQGQVASIIDDEEHACLLGSLSENQRVSVGLLHRSYLIAILKDLGTSRCRLYEDIV